jgi:hypothetical protein
MAEAPFAKDADNPVESEAAWLARELGATTYYYVAHLVQGAPGAWDAQVDLDAVTLAERAGRLYLYYAGRADEDQPWRMGLMISDDDGRSFTKHPANPLLAEGLLGDFDGRGVSDPAVLYDPARDLFRLWYTAHAFAGAATSVGYAVSADGVVWHKHPDGVALAAEAVGLTSVGHPSVLQDTRGLRMWVHGLEPGRDQHRIYELVNRGRPVDD